MTEAKQYPRWQVFLLIGIFLLMMGWAGGEDMKSAQVLSDCNYTEVGR